MFIMDRGNLVRFSGLAGAKTRQQLGDGGVVARRHNLRSDLVEGNEDEGPLGQARMRNLQVGFTEAKVSKHQDIQIEAARSVAHAGGAITSILLLYIEEFL